MPETDPAEPSTSAPEAVSDVTDTDAPETDVTEPTAPSESDDTGETVPSDGIESEDSDAIGDSYAPDVDITYCGMPEHIHSEACYNPLGELICGVEEHVHTELCYAPEQFGIMTMSVIHEESSADGYDFVLSLNGSGGYTLTFTGTKIPIGSELKQMLKIDGTDYSDLVNIIVVNDSVTEIGDNAFDHMLKLASVGFRGINPNIISIPNGCFQNCPLLTSVNLENLSALKSVGNRAFSGTNIKTVTIPSTVDKFEQEAFLYADSIETVYFEENEVLTNPPSFKQMKGLRNINLENLKAENVYIQSEMFKDCTSLESLYIPSNFSPSQMSAISYANIDNLCSGCASLRELVFAPNPRIRGLTNVTGGTAVENLDLSPLYELGYYSDPNSPVKSIVFDSSLENSGGVYLNGCSHLETVEFKSDVLADKIAEGAFGGCTSLRAIDLERFVNIKTIESDAFNGCSSIAELTIPSTVTAINDRAFNGMSDLKSMTLNANLESSSVNLFDGVSGLVLTVGEEVTTLNRDFLIALNGHFKDIIFPANSMLTLPAGDSVGGIFGDGTDEQTYYTDADGNLYLLKDGGLSLVHANKSLETVNIPATVGGYNVTGIASYAFENSAATSVTVDNPSAVTISEFAFTDAANLASVNDISEASEIKVLFANASAIPDVAFEGTNITNVSKVNPAENLSGASSAQSAEATYGNNTGIKATRQSEENLLTGQSGIIQLEVSNYDNEFYRVYIMVDDPRWFSEPTIDAQNEYIKVDGPKKVPGENIWYFDFIPIKEGNTLSTNISINTKNYPTPSGTSAYIWTAALSKDELNDSEVYYPHTGDGKEDNVFVSPDYIKITWNTEHKDFSLKKELNDDTDNYPLGFQKSATDDQVALKPISYHLGLTSDSGSSSGSGTEYGADYVKTVVFKDTFQLPEGLKWRDGIDVDKISKIITGNSASIYAEINGKEYLVAQVSGFGGAAGSITDIKLEKSTDGKITVVWTVENSSLDGASPSEISVNAESALISFGGDIILRENKSELTEYEVQNHTDADITFTHGDTQKVEADSEETTVKVTPREVSIEKTLVGTEPKRMNEPISYNLKIWNKEAYDATLPDIKDIFNGNDTSTRTIYLKPEEIERLFSEEPYGQYLTISVTDAYFLNEGVTVPTETFIAVDGETVGTRSYLDSTDNKLDDYRIFDEPNKGISRLQEFKGKKENVTYTYDADSDLIKFSYNGNEITVGENGKYTTLAAAMEDLKMYVGYTTQYHLDWKLKDQTITLPAGEELNIRINAYVKDSFMMLNGSTDDTMDIDHLFRAGYSGEWIYDRHGTWNDKLQQEFFKAINYAELVDTDHDDTEGPYRIDNDLDVVKDAYVDGEMIESDSDVRPDMDIEYALSLKHWGTGTYDTLPVVDHVSGLQAVLAPVDLNREAEWAQYADIHYVDGRAYYALSLKGTDSYTYKGVQFDEYFADRIVVSEQNGTDGKRTGLDTLLYFYFVDTLPFEYDREIRYPVTTDRGICLGDDAGTSNIATWGIYNAVWVNDVPGRRLTDVIGFNGSILNFEKKISTERGAVPSLDTVADISPISEGQNEVWYRMHLYNFSMTDSVAITGDQIYDILPQTYDKFTWSTDNVKIVWIDDSSNPTITYNQDGTQKSVKFENGEMKVDGVDKSLWTISETEPGSKRYRIDFDEKLQFSFAPMQSLYFYVVVKFPTDDTWDNYYKKVTDGDVDLPVENSLFVFNMEDRVEHYLVNPGKALLQKGVYEIGTYSVGDNAGTPSYKFYDYYIGHDRTHYSFNADDADGIEGQAQFNTVTYYIIIENTGDGKLYLTDVYDVLPEGFEFLSLRGAIGFKWNNNDNWYMNAWPDRYVGGIGIATSLNEAVSGGLDKLIVWAEDDKNHDNNSTTRFRNAQITTEYVAGSNTVVFRFQQKTDDNIPKMGFDEKVGESGALYLEKGEYVQIVYTAVTGSKEDLGNALSAENSAFMEYYVPGITDANVEVDTESGVTVSTANNLSSNDGDRKLWGLEEAEASGVKELKTINKEPKFLASSVDVLPGSIIPGVQKNLVGDASRQYNGAENAVNWDLKLFNDGDRAMPFDFEETIQSSLRFKGKMTYELYAGSKGIYTDVFDKPNGLLLTAIAAENSTFDQSEIENKVKVNYLFDFTGWDKDGDVDYALINTRDSSGGNLNEYKLYVGENGELGKLYKKVGDDGWTEVSNNLVKLQLVTINKLIDQGSHTNSLFESHSTFTYYVPIYLTKNGDGDLTFRVEFSKASLEEGSLDKTVANALAIPAGGHVIMNVGSEMPSGTDGGNVGTFMNTARVIPIDSFDPSYVTHGIDFKEGSKAGVESSAMINYHSGFLTESHKEIVELNVADNNDTSETIGDNDHKIFLDSSEKLFTYRLIFDNKNTDSQKTLKKLVFVDPLPETNDNYTLSSAKTRSSEFTVNFADANVKVYSVDVGADGTETKTEIPSSYYKVEYSITTEKSDLDGDGLNGTNNSSAWHEEPQSADRSMRVIINDDAAGTYLNTTDSTKYRRIIVEFNAKVSGDAEPGEVSWNNFAYRYTYEDKTAGDSNDKVLTAQTPVVGIQFPSERVIKKAVVDANGNPYTFDADKTYRFVIYYKNDQAEDDKSVDITDFSEKGIANALQELSDANKIVATLVELKVNKGESEGSISLDGLKTYTPGSDAFTVTGDEFSWTDGETYHVIEIADDSVVESVTFNGTPDQFDFTYNRSVGFVIKAENRVKTWDAKIVKTDNATGSLLSGTEFEIYTLREIEGVEPVTYDGKSLYLWKTVTTGENGTAELTGFTEDEYYIKEITAPTGYKNDYDGKFVKISRGTDGVVVTAKFADTKKPEPSKMRGLEIRKVMKGGTSSDKFNFTVTLTFPSKGVDTIDKNYIADNDYDDAGDYKKNRLTVKWTVESVSPAAALFNIPTFLSIREPIIIGGENAQEGKIENIELGDVQEINVTLNVNQRLCFDKLPDGTVYTVEEKIEELADKNIEPKIKTVTGAIAFNPDDNSPVSVEYENIRYSSLSFTKTVSPEEGNTDKEFTFMLTFKDESGKTLYDTYSYTVSNGGTVKSSGTVKSHGIISGIRHGDTVTVNKLPIGTQVYVGEFRPDDAFIDIKVGEASLETIPDDGGTYCGRTVAVGEKPASIEFLNTVPKGSLSIQKIAYNETKAFDGGVFTFRIVLTDSTGTPISGTFDTDIDGTAGTVSFNKTGVGTVKLSPGETVTIKNLPEGATYKVTETGGKLDGKDIDTKTYGAAIENGKGTITADSSVKVTNFEAVELRLNKKVVGGGEGPFNVTVKITEIPEDIAGSVEIKSEVYTKGGVRKDNSSVPVVNGGCTVKANLLPDGYLLITGIPKGAKATVSEDNSNYIKILAVGGEAVLLDNDKGHTLDSTKNVFDLFNITTGELQLTKTVSNIDSAFAGAFSFDITFTEPSSAVSTGNTEVDEIINNLETILSNAVVSNAVSSEVNGEKFTVTVRAGETVTVSNLPIGTGYTVTENVSADYELTESNNANGTISATPSETKFTNAIKLGSLEISKTVSGNAPTGDSFSFTVKLTLNGKPLTGEYDYIIGEASYTANFNTNGEATVSLQAGQTAVFAVLPYGTEYTVTENVSSDYNLKTETGSTGKIGETASKAEFTNEHKPGTLKISKTVTGNAPTGDSFSFTVKLTLNNEPLTGKYKYTIGSDEKEADFATGEATVSLQAGETAVFATLPYGTEYTVAENVPDNYELDSSTGTTGTIDNDESHAAFTNKVLTPGYEIKKTVEGADGDTVYVKPGEKVTYVITVTGSGDAGSVSKNINFSDKLPNWLEVIKIEPNGVGNPIDTDDTSEQGYITYKWHIDSLKNGETVTVRITAQVNEDISESKVWSNVVINPDEHDDPYDTSETVESDPGNLSIEKIVKDVLGKIRDADKTEFDFTIELTLPADSDKKLSKSYPYTLGTETGELKGTVTTDENGQAGTYSVKLATGENVKLANGDKLVISNLPTGATYTVTETLPEGTTYTNGTVTKIGTVSKSTPVVQFTNIYHPAPASGEISFTKKLTGELVNEDFTFKFTAKLQSVDGTAAEQVEGASDAVTVVNPTAEVELHSEAGKKEVTVDSGKFDITFNAAGKYVFLISEDESGYPAVHPDGEEYTAEFTVTEDGNGGLSVSGPVIARVGSEGTEAVFTNTFDPSVYSLSAKKTLSGNIRDGASYNFTILVKKTKDAGVEITNAEDVEIHLTELNKSNLSTSVTVINEKYERAGEYVYEITEKPENGDPFHGITFDESKYTVTVTVAEVGGQLTVSSAKIEKDGKPADTVEFANSYAPDSATAAVTLKKSIDKRGWTDDDDWAYTFELKPAEPDGKDTLGKTGILPDNTSVMTATAKSDGDGAGRATFGEITFTEAGNYYYTLSEAAIPESVHGITKDDSLVSVIISVTDVDGKLTAEVKYDGKDSVEFVNKFTSGTATIGGTKKFSGRSWTSKDSDVFEFTLKPVGNAPMPQGSDGSCTKKAQTDGDGTYGSFTFPSITYTEPGTYEYTVSETGGSADRVTNDGSTVSVKVVIDEDFKPSVTYSYNGGAYSQTRPVFTNIYTPEPVTRHFEAEKKISGRDWSDAVDSGRYEFTLTPVPENSDCPMPEGGKFTVTAGNGGKIVFPDISFDKVGTYVYQIAEEAYNKNGITSSTEVHTATVVISDSNGDGVLESSVKYDTSGTPTFTNTYTRGTADATVSVNKKLLKDGVEQSLTDYTFSFTMTAGANPDGGMTLPEKKTATVSADNAKAEFGKITFTKAGKYSVTVTEDDNGEDVGYDERTLTVHFEVTENISDGTLTVKSVVYEFDDGSNGPIFVNTLEPSRPDITIEKTQQVNDGDATKQKLEVKPGDEVTYYLKVTSIGEDGSIAKNVIVSDEIPEGLTLVDGSIFDGGTESGGIITWNLSDIPKGTSKTVSFKVTVPEIVGGASWTNIAYAGFDRPDNPDEPDNPDKPDNPEKEIPSNKVEIEEPVPDITIEKTQ